MTVLSMATFMCIRTALNPSCLMTLPGLGPALSALGC